MNEPHREADMNKIKELADILRNCQFDFIPNGEFKLSGRDGIYARVIREYPDLCNNSYLCFMHCQSDSRQPEWQHGPVRGVLDSLKKKQLRVSEGHSRGYWMFD